MIDKKNNFILRVQKKINKLSIKNSSQKKFYIKKKIKYQLFTNLDLKIEKYIRQEIKKNFPKDNIFGEEFKNKLNKSKFTWYIDPIDGTKNLILNIPTWSNMIGLFYKDKAINSLINFPMLKKYYYSINSKSFLIEKKKPKIIKSSIIKDINKAKIVFNSLHTINNKKISHFIKKFKGFLRVTGIDSYNFCLLAEGKIDIIIEKGLKIVDIMPNIALIENAGGVITDWDGGKKFEKGKIVASSNKILHAKILKTIKNI